jgi:hypothetical protein
MSKNATKMVGIEIKKANSQLSVEATFCFGKFVVIVQVSSFRQRMTNFCDEIQTSSPGQIPLSEMPESVAKNYVRPVAFYTLFVLSQGWLKNYRDDGLSLGDFTGPGNADERSFRSQIQPV